MQLTQIAKIVQCVAPIDGNGAARDGARVNMAKYDHVAFIVGLGNVAADIIITMFSAATSAAAGTVMGFSYRRGTNLAALETVVDTSPLVTVGVGGLTIANATEDNDCIVIEVNAADLPAPTTRQYVGITFSNPGAACLISCHAVCCWPRYMADADVMPDPTVA